INKNRITCKCKKGYHGKYCENWYCNKNCNNNGICEGPYTCHCYPFYHGKHCDMYQVDKNMDPEINKKLCYHHNNSIKCFCSKDLITRKYCIKILCIQLNIPQHNENLLEILDFSCDCTKDFKDIKIQCCFFHFYDIDYTFIPFNQLILKNLYKKISFLISVISIILFVAIMINIESKIFNSALFSSTLVRDIRSVYIFICASKVIEFYSIENCIAVNQ
ncbi:hypothetical protein HZS_3373, partial [Henneguya salminicola]